MLQTDIKEDFLDIFYHEVENLKLEGNNILNAYTLKIQNNSFAYNELIESLGDKLHYFALSRAEVKKLKDSDKLRSLIDKSKAKLRAYSSNEGELGEILLYCLLEANLNAPKVLTKLELKTSSNDYVKGADGVHLLKLDESNYQLILGESKLYTELGDGINQSFLSIAKFLGDGSDKLTFELDLINSQLIKEAYDEHLYNFLKGIIIPSAKNDNIYTDYSFGIFLGFNLEITEEDKKLSNSDFRIEIRARIKEMINSKVASFNRHLQKSEFVGYKFYVYVIPFSDLQNIRIKAIQKLQS